MKPKYEQFYILTYKSSQYKYYVNVYNIYFEVYTYLCINV